MVQNFPAKDFATFVKNFRVTKNSKCTRTLKAGGARNRNVRKRGLHCDNVIDVDNIINAYNMIK